MGDLSNEAHLLAGAVNNLRKPMLLIALQEYALFVAHQGL